MRRLIIPALLSCFFFIFLVDQVQNAYDRQTPQFLLLAILNFCSLAYLFYKFSINTIISHVKYNKSFLFYCGYIIISGISIIIAENKVEAVITYSRYLTYFTTFFIILIIIKAYKFNIIDFFFKIIIASVIIESAGVLSVIIDNVIVNGNDFTRGNDYRGFSANINLVAFSIFLNDISGQIFTLFILTVAAAEAAIGLAIIVVYYRNSSTIRVEDINSLKG